jgi:hypothetical protein
MPILPRFSVLIQTIPSIPRPDILIAKIKFQLDYRTCRARILQRRDERAVSSGKGVIHGERKSHTELCIALGKTAPKGPITTSTPEAARPINSTRGVTLTGRRQFRAVCGIHFAIMGITLRLSP